ncbi:MAG: DUF1573 domain-containing protein [Puniceicoccales bacterium]
MRAVATVVTIGLLPAICAASALHWDAMELNVPCELGQEEVLVVFPFHNEGDVQIEIAQVDSIADGIVAEWEKKSYAPGESGELRVVFAVNGRIGPQRKALKVTTNEADEQETVRLVFATTIPELGKIRPNVLLWKREDGDRERSVRLEMAPGVRWKIDEAFDGVSYVVNDREGPDGGAVTLGIKPKHGERVPSELLRVEFSDEEGRTEVKELHLLTAVDED